MAHARRGLCLCALLAFVSLSGCVDFPPDYNVCLSCEQGIEAGAGDELDVTVERSDLEIRVAEDGSARWRVRADLSGGNVSELADDPDRVDRIADRAVTDRVRIDLITQYAAHGGDVRNVSAHLEDRRLVITFSVPSFGYRSAHGVTVVDTFHAKGERPPSYRLGTDRIVVRGPPGTVVTSDPSGAAITGDGDAVTWEGAGTRVSGETYLVLGDDRGLATRSATSLAVGADVARWLIPDLYVAIPGSIAFLVVGVVGTQWRARGRVEWDGLTKTVLAEQTRLLATIFTWSGMGIVVLAGSAVAVAAGDLGGVGRGLVWTFVTKWPVVPVVLFGFLGWDVGRDGRFREQLLLAIVLVPFAMVAPWVATPVPPGFRSPVGMELTYHAAVVLTVGLGGGAFYVGHRIAGESLADR